VFFTILCNFIKKKGYFFL